MGGRLLHSLMAIVFYSDLWQLAMTSIEKNEVATSVLTMRSPGAISISQEELLGLDQATTMEPVQEGDLMRANVQIRPKEALQLLEENQYLIYEPSDNFELFSFYFGGFIKNRYFAIVMEESISLKEKINDQSSGKYQVFPEQMVSMGEKRAIQIVPQSISYFMYLNTFYISMEINTLKEMGKNDKQWLALWELSIQTSDSGEEEVVQRYRSGEVDPVAHPTGIICKGTNTIMQIRKMEGTARIFVFRYCLPSEPETAAYLYSYEWKNDRLLSLNIFRGLTLEGNFSYLRLQFHSVLAPYILFFCKEFTIYLKMNDLIDQAIAGSDNLKAGVLNRVENFRGTCNFMSLGVIGCSTKGKSTEKGSDGKYKPKYVFTEFYGFEENIVQYTPLTHVVDIPGVEYTSSNVNSINLNHFIVTQIQKDTIMLTSRKVGVQAKNYTFPGYHFIKMIDFYVEDNPKDKFNGYIMAAYRKRDEDDEFPSPIVEISLFKVSLPYFEIETSESLVSSSCDRYLSNCAELKVRFIDPEADSTHRSDIYKNIYLINSGFSGILKVKNRNEDLSELVLNMEHYVDLQQYYQGLITQAKIIGDLGKLVDDKKPPKEIMTDSEVLVGSEEGQIVASNLHSFNVRMDVPEIGEPRTTIQWNLIRFFKDNSFSFVLFLRREPYEGNPIPTLVTLFPRVSLFLQNQTISTSFRQVFTYEELRGWKIIPFDLSKYSPETTDFLAFRAVGSKVEYLRKTILKTEKLDESNTGRLEVVTLQTGEVFQDARLFLDTENSILVTITNKSIILSQIDILDGFGLSTIAIIEMNKIKIEAEVAVKIVDVLIEGDYLLIDTIVEDFNADPSTKREFTKIFVYRLFKSKRTSQLFGHVAFSPKAVEDHHVFFSYVHRKMIFVDLVRLELWEFSLDEGIQWYEKNVPSLKTAHLKPLTTLYLRDMAGIAPDMDRLVLAQEVSGLGPNQTFTAVRRGGYFPLKVLLGKESSMKNQMDRDTRLMLFKISNHGVLSLVRLNARMERKWTLQAPQNLGEYNTDIFPMIRTNPGNSTLTLYLLYTGSYMFVKYSQIFFREDQKSAKLKIILKDLSDQSYEDKFLARRDQKYNFVEFSKAKSKIYSGVFTYNYSEMGLVSATEAYCANDTTIMKFNRFLEGFSCPKSDFNITSEAGMVRESTLSIDGTSTKGIKHLVLTRPTQLVYRSLFVLLADTSLVFFRSIGSSLQNSLILQLTREYSDDIGFNFDSCMRINRVQREKTIGEDNILISIFCANITKYAEYEIAVPFKYLEEAENTRTPSILNVEFGRSWDVTPRIWRSVVEEDTQMLMNETLLIVKSKITLPSIGEKDIMEFYARDDVNGKYKLALTSLNDKYDSFDVVAFTSTGFSSPNLDIIMGEVYQVKYNKKTGEVKIIQSAISYKMSEISGTSTLIYEKVLAPQPTRLLQASIHYLFYNRNEYRVIIYIVDQDYIHEYYAAQSTNVDGKDQPIKSYFTLKFTRKYNYVGLCSEKSTFKLSPGRENLKVNCIPPDNEDAPNNLIIYKRPSIDEMAETENLKYNPPYNATHILTQSTGYSSANAHHFLISSDDGTEVRLIKTAVATLVNQYKINSEWKLKIKSDSGVFTRNKIYLNISNFFTSKAYELVFDYNELTIMNRFMDIFRRQISVILVIGTYILCLLVLLCTPYLSWIIVTIKEWKDNIRLNHNLRIRSELIKQRVGKGIIQGGKDEDKSHKTKNDSLSMSLIESPMD